MDVAFDGFPADGGLWWLRWMDHGAATATSRSSFLHLLFSALPDGTRADALPVLDAELAARPSASHRAEAHVGWLPVLRIGLVVQAGTVVGELGAEVRRFLLEAHRHEERTELLLGADPAAIDVARRRRLVAFPAEPSFESGDRPGLLPPRDYPLPGVRDGRLLRLGPKKATGGPTVLLPCAEVVRVAYAPHAALARAVVDQSWSRGMAQVLDMGRTGLVGDGSAWQVAPRARLRAEHVAVAANLALNPVGRRRANLVHAGLHTTRRGVLAALLPFEWEVLELDAACVRLRTADDGERWFGYAIEGVRWPPPPMGPPRTIVLVPGGARRPGRLRRADAPGLFPRDDAGDGRGGGPARPRGRVVQGADPRPAAPLEVAARGTAWLDAPVVFRAEKALGVAPGGERRHAGRTRRAAAAGRLAAAEPGGSGTGPAPADPQSIAPAGAASLPSAHFQEVSAMLGRLVARRAIEASEVEAAEGPELERRGGIAAWAFPEVPVPGKGPEEPARRWYVRDFVRRMPSGETTEPVRRAAMVRRLSAAGGRFAYWVEIEPRPYLHDRYRSLVFATTGAMPVQAVIRRLLDLAARRAGVWPSPAMLEALVAAGGRSGVGTCARWGHVRERPAGNVPKRHWPLFADSALVAIREVLPP